MMAFGVLLGSTGESFALPKCEGSPHTGSFSGIRSWDNCEGTFVGDHAYGMWAGDKWVGEFKNGNFHGQGTYYFLEDTKFKGDKYVGEYWNGVKQGQGTYYFLANNQSKGAIYVGEFKNNNKHGQGTYAYADGNRYVGEFKGGKRNGQGTYTYANGRVEEGIWENNKFKYAQKVTPTVTAKKSPEPSSQVQKENERLRKKIARLEKKEEAKTQNCQTSCQEDRTQSRPAETS